MNYYDPGLALWLTDSERPLVPISISIVGRLNRVIAASYATANIPTADVARAFATGDLKHQATLAGHGRVPLAVARICTWTGNCETPPNPHGTAAGYRVIARTFWTVLGRLASPLRGGAAP
jgi:hypothetical protein